MYTTDANLEWVCGHRYVEEVILTSGGHLVRGYRYPLQMSRTDIGDSEGEPQIWPHVLLDLRNHIWFYLISRQNCVKRDHLEVVDVLWSLKYGL